MTLNKNDFVEVNFTGKTAEGALFDSNIKGKLEEIGSKQKGEPFVFALGQDMFLKGIDDFLVGKDIGKYTIELEAKNAFGPRNPKMIQLIPESVFRKHNTRPTPGVMFNFDGRIAKILSVSGGRVRVDFNNPLAGKDVVYDIEVTRVVSDVKEKVSALIDFFFRQKLEFKVKGKELAIKAPAQMAKFMLMFKDKFKEMVDLDLSIEEMK